MIKTFFIVIIYSIILSGNNIEKWKYYKNEEFHFIIEYPSDWNINVNSGNPNRVLIISEPASENLAVLSNVDILIEDSPNVVLALRYNMKMLEFNGNRSMTDLEILHKEEIDFNNNEAIEYIATAKIYGMTTKWRQILFIRDKLYYEMSYTTSIEKFEKHRELADKIISSIKWK